MSSVVLVDIGIGKTKVNAFRYSRHIDVVSANAFMNNMNLTAIELPDVDLFQDKTFSGCSALQELTLPAIDYTDVNLFGDDVPPTLNKLTFKKVEDKQLKLGNAFSRLSSLKQVDFDGALAEFDCNSMQSSKDIKFLDLGNICNVFENALSGMSSLEEVHVPVQECIKTLGLQNLKNLKKVVINVNESNAISSLDDGLLNDVHADEIRFQKGGITIASVHPGALSGLSVKAIDLALSKIQDLPSGSFRDDSTLTEVTFGPLQLTSIQENAFEGCNDVKITDAYGLSYLKVMHPHGAKQLTLQRMYSSACLKFAYASAFMNVKLEWPELNTPALVHADEYSFANVQNLISADFGCKLHYMPDHCYAFNSDLQHVTIQSNVDVIKSNAFEGCNKLSSIKLAGSAIRLDDYAFQNLSSLTEFDMSKVTYVGEYALENCIGLSFDSNSLHNIKHIGEFGLANAIHTVKQDIRYELNPALFKSIEQNAFAGCEIAGFNVKMHLAQLDEALRSKIGESIVPVSRDAKDIVSKYQLLKSWLGVASDFEMILDDFVFNTNGIGLDYTCFIYNNSRDQITRLRVNDDLGKFIKNPIFPARAKSIAYNALNVDFFKENITSLSLNNIASVDVGQFSDCRSLTSFYAPKLESLPECCLCGCVKLHDINLDKCSSIASTALYGCSQISSASVPLQATTYGDVPQLHKALSRAVAFSSSGDRDTFIEDPFNDGRIKSVDDNTITVGDDGLLGKGIPDKFENNNEITSIGSYSMMATTKITHLTVGTNVKVIEDYAFTDNTSIKEVFLSTATTKPVCLSSIGQHAFERSAVSAFNYINIRNVDGKFITTVYDYGLNKSNALQKLSVSEGYTEVAPSAFVNCEPVLSSVHLPETLTSIGEYAFADTYTYFPRIEDINLSQLTKLESVGDFAFYNSIKTTSTDANEGKKLLLPSSLKTIGAAAFGYSIDTRTQNIEYVSCDAEDIGPSAFMRSHVREFKLGDSLTSIGDYAFANPKYKFSMLIPEKITSIGMGAFKRNVILNPDAVEKNIISIDVNTVGEMLDAMHTELSDDYTAFNTVSATDDTVFLATKATKNNNFIYVKNNKLNACPKDLSIDILEREVIGCDLTATSAFIPEYVYHVGESAFMNCTALTSVSSVNETLDISESAFYGCTSLEGINLPDSFYLSAVPAYAFYDCHKLNNIRILSTASYVGKFAFAHCTSLSSAQDINAAEKSNYTLSIIGNNAFDGCTSLSSFFIPHDISTLGDSIFKGCTSLKRVEIDLDAQYFLDVVGKSDVISSVNEAVKSKFSNINEDAECAIVFNDAVYMNDGTVKVDDEYVTITSKDSISSVEAFNYEMFADSSMTYLNLSNITNINQFVFRDTQTLETINFLPGDQHLESIGDYAFSKCSYLRTVNGNSLSVKSIGMYAFAGCSLISKMTIDGDEISGVGYGAFSGARLQELVFTFAQSKNDTGGYDTLDANECKQIIVSAIHYDEDSNPNPLELPEDCVIILKGKQTDATFGKYDYMMNDMMYADVDINRNQMVFVDKRNNAIKPLLIVKSLPNRLPAIVDNKFHMNVIGRWK